MTPFTADNVTSQQGRTIIVTGANTGIGFEAAKALAARGARVVLACRDETKANDAMRRIEQQTPGADLAFLPLDQSDLVSVRRAADQASREQRLDVVLNNAGVMIPPLMRTVQGFELQFGVNHLATFALTGLLLPKLSETAGSRVVVTSSLAHLSAKMDWDDLNAERGYVKTQRYYSSKLANLLFVLELDRRLRAAGSSVTAIACHPGVARTELNRHAVSAKVFNVLMSPFQNTPAQGAWPALQAATDPEAEGGDYYGPQRFGGASGPSGPAKRSAAASDQEQARRLWDISVKLTGVDPGLPPA